MNSIRCLRGLAALPVLVAALATGQQDARADHAALVVTGAADTVSLDAAAVAFSERLRDLEWTVFIAKPTAVQKKQIGDCVKERRDCAAVFSAWPEAESIILVELVAKQEGMIEIYGSITARPGHPLGSDQRFCESCRPESLRRLAAELGDSLVKIAGARRNRSVLRIRSVPPGARVMIDNVKVGVTPIDYGVFSGPHTIGLDKDGYQIEVRQTQVREGEHRTIEVELQPTGSGARGAGSPEGPETPGRGSPRRRWLPPALIGAGAVAIAGGVTLMILDSDPVDGTAGQQYRYRESMLAGVALGLAGAATATIGGILLWKGRRAAAPAVAASDQEIWLGAVGSF